MKRISMLLAAALAAAPALASAQALTVKGSDTMVILAQRWAELYMKQGPG
jgi:phosphate transport system substrate-binding protein